MCICVAAVDTYSSDSVFMCINWAVCLRCDWRQYLTSYRFSLHKKHLEREWMEKKNNNFRRFAQFTCTQLEWQLSLNLFDIEYATIDWDTYMYFTVAAIIQTCDTYVKCNASRLQYRPMTSSAQNSSEMISFLFCLHWIWVFFCCAQLIWNV